ncbi:MAG: alanine--tRNA ligase, partial [Desulfobacterales bacterium]|nr:alanine--tRNA ligase [Desulfobacterales bacterium]
PKPSIDTGLGLERMASVLQDTPTNFDTDLIFPLIQKAEELSETAFGENRDADVAMKVIADHSRAAAFLIGDGILPSNEGRGYVLRRIMRRAIRYGRNLGLNRPFLHQTTRVVFDIMKGAYPDLAEASSFITSVIENEEKRFLETLDNGLRLLNDTLEELKAKGESEVPGHVIFKLYDTYGFPVDIVRDVLRDGRMTLDMKGFEDGMEAQRARSRSVATYEGLGEAYKGLSAAGVKSRFVGYDQIQCDAETLLLVVDGAELEMVSTGNEVEIVTDVTPFYGESGGQMGDVGVVKSDAGLSIAITDTIKDPTGLIIHKGRVDVGEIRKGDAVTLVVDKEKRDATRRNHTATHILQAVLRQELGDHVKQAGSHVGPDRLRFDFTHFSSVDDETMDRIEALVNQRVLENAPTNTVEMEAEEAFKSGATALFEEKYGDVVRVVSLSDFSKEL